MAIGSFSNGDTGLDIRTKLNAAIAYIDAATTAGTAFLTAASVAAQKTLLSLNAVENTALSTWAGSANITTLGTIVTGVWTGTAVAVANGGTGATDASGARTNLGLGTLAVVNAASVGALAGVTTLGSTGLWTNTQLALGTATTPGSLLTNTTAAAAGAQQVSPSLQFTAQGWKTTSTAASQTVDFRQYVLPIEGTTSPTASWLLQSQVNGGGWTTRINSRADGKLVIGSQGSSGYLLDGAGGGGMIFGRLDDGDVGFMGNFGQPGIILRSAAFFQFSASNSTSAFGGQSGDTFIGRGGAAATIQLGVTHATVGTNQTIQAHTVTTGTGPDLILKGGAGSVTAGNVRFGTYAADLGVAIQGYITIKDEAGNARKVAIVA